MGCLRDRLRRLLGESDVGTFWVYTQKVPTLDSRHRGGGL